MADEKPRVLICHDHEQESASLRTILQILDCTTEVVSNIRDILQKAEQNPPNLILIDLGMSTTDGYEIAKVIRGSQLNGEIPILFLADLVEGKSKSAIISNLSATDLLRKPYYPFELISRCKTLLNLKRYEEELEMAEQVLQSLALAVEARDPTTGNHCDRLFYRLANMAEALCLNKDVKDTLLKGAVLHDIGKVGVPDQVLLKEGPLTDREWEMMRQHVIVGESLCRPLKFLHPVMPLIRHHHERFNGSGYPDGLAADKIPLVARIFQVCDVFDALTHLRPYKPAFSYAESTDILRGETAHGCWDPDIVEVFLDVLKTDHPG